MDDLLTLGCLGYDGGDGPTRREQARDRLAEQPELADRDIFVASMLGRSQTVAALVEASPSSATNAGGPRDWPPLLYLTYGRVPQLRDGESHVAAARVLLDAGADPNSEWLWGGTYRFTALTGCFGEGEGGPWALPEHPECMPLARLLLERGARPNDGQALYNRMFTPGSACLQLLLEFGLGPDDRINWPIDDPAPRTTMSYQLFHAAHQGYVDRVDLLIDAGVHLDETDDGTSIWKAAYVSGRPEVVTRLEQAGLRPEPLEPTEELAGALRCGRHDRVRGMVSAQPELLAEAEASHGDLLVDMISRGDLTGIDLLLSLGIDINRNRHTPAAHHAALHGQVEALRLLLARGADPHLLDERFNATALGWARHAGKPETAAILEALENES